MMCIYLDNGNASKLPPMTNPETTTNINDPETSTNTNEKNYSKIYEKYSKLFMILAVVFFATTVASTVIIVILTWKLCDQKRNNGQLAITNNITITGVTLFCRC